MAGYDPNQPRDNEGQWTDTGVSSAYKQASIKDMRRILEEKNISTSHIGTNRSLLEQRTMLKKLMEENELEVPFIQNIDKVEEAAKDAAGLSKIVSIGQQRFRDGKLRDPRGDKTILSLASEPVPSNSSQGKWLVMVELKSNLGNGRQPSNIPFWRKSEALEAIEYLKSFNLSEYNWR